MNAIKKIYLEINLSSASRSPTAAVPKRRRHLAGDKSHPSGLPSPAGSPGKCSVMFPNQRKPAGLPRFEIGLGLNASDFVTLWF